MLTSSDLVAWATRQAQALEADMRWKHGDAGYGGWWEADRPELKSVIRARATSALDFLQRFAGADSQWSRRAQQVFDNNGDRESMESGARALADILREWANQVGAGTFVPRYVEAQGARVIASTDLMDQVRVLIEDKSIHPAAPIVLAGAALEVALRSAVEELELHLTERPSITAYARHLRREGVLSAQDVKDVEQMAGVRNSTAHGEFDALSRERSGLLEQQVNLFLGRLATLLEPQRRAEADPMIPS